MSPKLSFVERLRAKRSEEESLKAERAAEVAHKEREAVERKWDIESTFKKHLDFGKKTVFPILNMVNRQFLTGNGMIRVLLISSYDCSRGRGDYKIGDGIAWKLSWNEDSETRMSGSGGTDITKSWGKNLIIFLWLGGKVNIYAGLINVGQMKYKKPLNKGELNVNNADDVNQIEDLIIQAIEDGSCFYHN